MMFNCIIAGVGGQGTVLASKIIASAAMSRGLNVRTTETIGMAQRGGAVVSHVRAGDVIHSPLIAKNKADIIIAFEPAEAVRCMQYLAENGVMLVCDIAVKPITCTLSGSDYNAEVMLDYLKANVKKLNVINGDAIAKRCGGTKTLNVALLGAAAKKNALPFDVRALKDAVREIVHERFWEINFTSLEIGGEIV